MDLQPIFEITGIAFATMGVEYLLEKFGHGDKVVFVRIVGYAAVAFYGIRTWFNYLHRTAALFGVFV